MIDNSHNGDSGAGARKSEGRESFYQPAPLSYSDKLRDPRWQKKRLQVLERDNWKCACCLSDDRPLHVHHLVYSKGQPWECPDEHLETLCEECHEFRERINDLYGRSLVPTAVCSWWYYSVAPIMEGRIPWKPEYLDRVKFAAACRTYWTERERSISASTEVAGGVPQDVHAKPVTPQCEAPAQIASAMPGNPGREETIKPPSLSGSNRPGETLVRSPIAALCNTEATAQRTQQSNNRPI